MATTAEYQWYIDWADDAYSHPNVFIPPEHVWDYRVTWGTTLDAASPELGLITAGTGGLSLFEETGMYVIPGTFLKDQLENPHRWALYINSILVRQGRAIPTLGPNLGSDVQPALWTLEGPWGSQLAELIEFNAPAGTLAEALTALATATGITMSASSTLAARRLSAIAWRGSLAGLINAIADMGPGWAIETANGHIILLDVAHGATLSGVLEIDESWNVGVANSGLGPQHALVRTRMTIPGVGEAEDELVVFGDEERWGRRTLWLPPWLENTATGRNSAFNAALNRSAPQTFVRLDLQDTAEAPPDPIQQLLSQGEFSGTFLQNRGLVRPEGWVAAPSNTPNALLFGFSSVQLPGGGPVRNLPRLTGVVTLTFSAGQPISFTFDNAELVPQFGGIFYFADSAPNPLAAFALAIGGEVVVAFDFDVPNRFAGQAGTRINALAAFATPGATIESVLPSPAGSLTSRFTVLRATLSGGHDRPPARLLEGLTPGEPGLVKRVTLGQPIVTVADDQLSATAILPSSPDGTSRWWHFRRWNPDTETWGPYTRAVQYTANAANEVVTMTPLVANTFYEVEFTFDKDFAPDCSISTVFVTKLNPVLLQGSSIDVAGDWSLQYARADASAIGVANTPRWVPNPLPNNPTLVICTAIADRFGFVIDLSVSPWALRLSLPRPLPDFIPESWLLNVRPGSDRRIMGSVRIKVGTFDQTVDVDLSTWHIQTVGNIYRSADTDFDADALTFDQRVAFLRAARTGGQMNVTSTLAFE